MNIYEKTLETGYEYTCHDIFGVITINSKMKLGKNILDSIIVGVLAVKSNSKIVSGEISGHDITYSFERVNDWNDDEIEVEKDNLAEQSDQPTKNTSFLATIWGMIKKIYGSNSGNL